MQHHPLDTAGTQLRELVTLFTTVFVETESLIRRFSLHLGELDNTFIHIGTRPKTESIDNYFNPSFKMFDHKNGIPIHGTGSPALATLGDVTPPSRVPTPLRGTPRSLRPYVYALMAFKHGKEFQTRQSKHRTRRMSIIADKEGPFAPALTVSTNQMIVNNNS